MEKFSKVFGNNVILEKTTGERVTKSGIKVPTSPEDNKQHGKVVLIGEHVKKQLKLGSVVAYSKEILYEDKNYVIVKDTEILALISK